MRYVKTGPVIDPGDYLEYLQGAANQLPAGARAFATAEWHYDFHGARCVKDLELGLLEVSDAGDQGQCVSVDLYLLPNKFKHAAGLRIQYADASRLAMSTGSVPLGHHRLGPLILDDLLPDGEGGCAHEIAFHGGIITVVATDIVARWDNDA